jgi:hypothetical protein
MLFAGASFFYGIKIANSGTDSRNLIPLITQTIPKLECDYFRKLTCILKKLNWNFI